MFQGSVPGLTGIICSWLKHEHLWGRTWILKTRVCFFMYSLLFAGVCHWLWLHQNCEYYLLTKAWRKSEGNQATGSGVLSNRHKVRLILIKLWQIVPSMLYGDNLIQQSLTRKEIGWVGYLSETFGPGCGSDNERGKWHTSSQKGTENKVTL